MAIRPPTEIANPAWALRLGGSWHLGVSEYNKCIHMVFTRSHRIRVSSCTVIPTSKTRLTREFEAHEDMVPTARYVTLTIVVSVAAAAVRGFTL